jgi:hypothetical protein
MAESSRAAKGHFRGKPRPGRRVEVSYAKEGTTPTLGFTKNIGVGGAFILTSQPSAPGTRLNVVLKVPSGPAIEVDAEVRWIIDGKRGEPEAEQGMGVKFSGLRVEQLMALNEYFASLTATVDIDEA